MIPVEVPRMLFDSYPQLASVISHMPQIVPFLLTVRLYIRNQMQLKNFEIAEGNASLIDAVTLEVQNSSEVLVNVGPEGSETTQSINITTDFEGSARVIPPGGSENKPIQLTQQSPVRIVMADVFAELLPKKE
jgi:hypothetical protein